MLLKALPMQESLSSSMHMLCNSITNLCLQETHWLSSAYFITDAGFLLINSGQSETEDVETAGVGVLIAPSMRRSVVSFCQASSRMVSLNIRVPGGKMTVCSIYAPHNGKSVEERRSLFHNMSTWLTSRSRHGPLCVLRDFNARLHRRFEADPPFIGPFVFGNPDAQVDASSNRSFLVELCERNHLAVADTFIERLAEEQATYYTVGANPSSEANFKNFGQLDLMMISYDDLDVVTDVRSHLQIPLASHHFLVTVALQV